MSTYRGDQIEDFENFGLDPRRFYRLLRTPDELRRSAESLRGLPLTSEHCSISLDEVPRELIVGAIGSKVRCDGNYIFAPLTIWTQGAIDGIASGKKRQLSCGSRFDLDMTTPGVFRGQPYDFIIKNLTGHHVSLCASGRLGMDCSITLNTNAEDTSEKRKRFAFA